MLFDEEKRKKSAEIGAPRAYLVDVGSDLWSLIGSLQ
jgi:hypothetical protein